MALYSLIVLICR